MMSPKGDVLLSLRTNFTSSIIFCKSVVAHQYVRCVGGIRPADQSRPHSSADPERVVRMGPQMLRATRKEGRYDT
jgi:hypothetical protein